MTRISRRALVLVTASVVAMSAQGQIVDKMTPERVHKAIEAGTQAKEVRPYRIQEKAHFSLHPSFPPKIAVFTTPFLRVALAAHAARIQQKIFKETDLTPEMAAPEIHVYAQGQKVDGTNIATPISILVRPRKILDTNRTVRPIRMEIAPKEYQQLYGFDTTVSALLAVFPEEVWREDNEVQVIFDREIPSDRGPRARGGCKDCRSQISLGKVHELDGLRGGRVGDTPRYPLIAELNGGYSVLRPDRNSGKFENQGQAWGLQFGVGARFHPNWVMDFNVIALDRKYPTPESLWQNEGWFGHIDRLMVLRTSGGELGIRAMTTLRPLELSAGAGVGLYRSKLVAYGSILGFPGEYKSSEKWGPGLRLSAGGDLAIQRNVRLGFECRYLYLTGDFGELSPGGVNIGGFQAMFKLAILRRITRAEH